MCYIMHVSLDTWNLSSMYIFENENFYIDFNVTNLHGLTPLHLTLTCCHGQFEVVNYILENSQGKGIDIRVKDNHQRTPEDLARQEGHSNIISLFQDLMKNK